MKTKQKRHQMHAQQHLAVADAVDTMEFGGCHGCLAALKCLARELRHFGEVDARKVHVHGREFEEHVVAELIEEHALRAQRACVIVKEAQWNCAPASILLC